MSESPRPAPPGFSRDAWEEFDQNGILIFEDAIPPEDVERYKNAIFEARDADPGYDGGGYYGPQNFVERHPTFAELIDHERHIGFAYDLYGELLKLHESQIFCRPPEGKKYNIWHPDGARVVPYGVFSPYLPLQIKVGYWLTDLPHERMGNFVYMPGSHRTEYLDQYDTHEPAPGEKVLEVRAGTMTIMYHSLWHRVEPNESDVTRMNLFLAYCPSWITPSDRYQSDPEWLGTLTREQRIIMRSYAHPYSNAKPPASDFPLFLDRETLSDRDPGAYRDSVELHRRKRRTPIEKMLPIPAELV